MLGTLIMVGGAVFAYNWYKENNNSYPDSKYNSEEEFSRFDDAKNEYERAKRNFENVKEEVVSSKNKYEEYNKF